MIQKQLKKQTNMRKVKLLLVALIVATFAFTGCKKYEEGPSLSLRSKTTRITGEWKMAKKQFNGVTVDINADEKTTIHVINKDGSLILKTQYGNITGTWEFSDDKTRYISKTEMLGHITTKNEEILRLTNKELILEEIKDGDKTRTEFEKL